MYLWNFEYPVFALSNAGNDKEAASAVAISLLEDGESGSDVDHSLYLILGDQPQATKTAKGASFGTFSCSYASI